MSNYRLILKQGLSLAGSGDLEAALQKLGEGLEQARRANDRKWSALLARNIGLLYIEKGELKEARILFETSLADDQKNPALYFALGEICEQAGETSRAQEYYLTCYQLSKETHDQEMLDLLEKRRHS